MNRILIIGIIIAVVIGSISITVFFTMEKQVTVNEPLSEFKSEKQFSGPFSIDKYHYRLGDNVFMVIENLFSHDKGHVMFIRPDNKTYIELPFDGSKKDSFNYYFRPDLSLAKKICSKDDLVGKWKVVFEGSPYLPLNFEIINETVIGMEKIYDQKRC